MATFELSASPSRRYLRYETGRIRKVHATASLFIVIGLIQLIAYQAFKSKEYPNILVPGFMWDLIILVCWFLIVYAELYNKFPVNWTMAFVAVQCVTMDTMVSFVWYYLTSRNAALSVILASIINFIIHTLSLHLPVEQLPGYHLTMTLTFIYALSYMLSSIVIFVRSRMHLFIVVDIISLTYNCLLMLFAGTLIRNRRLTNIKSREYVLSANFIAYFYFSSIQLVASIVFDVIQGGNDL